MDELERPEVAEGELIMWCSMMICVSVPDESDRDVRSSELRPVRSDARELLPNESWGLYMFTAPRDVVAIAIQAAEQCYHENTRFRWGEVSKGRPRKRVVYALGERHDLTKVLLAWFRSLAHDKRIAKAARQVFLRDDEVLTREIAKSGVGFAPPGTGGLQLHRDDDHGFTLLLATDCIRENDGVVVFLPNSDHAEWHRDRSGRSHKTISAWPYEKVMTTSEKPGQCWLFPSSTLHYGRPNGSNDHWRILFNLTLGNDSSVDTIR